MEIPFINEKLASLVQTHETRDPFKIAKERNIILLEEDLGEIYGYYCKIKRIPFIHINKHLAFETKIFTCGHELGHSVLHPDEKTPQLSKTSIVSECKIEKEANYFATNLLVEPELREYYRKTNYEILASYGLPEELARFL